MTASSHTTRPAQRVSVASAAGVFDTLEEVFWSLCRGPAARLVLPGRMFASGRRRPVGLAEARELLLWPGRMDPDRRDAVWVVLVRRAQSGDPAWIVGTAGVLAPGLRRVVDRLSAGFSGDRDDLEAEVLAGFLTALHTVDPDSGRLPSRLCWAGYRAGLALRHRDAEAARRRAAGVDATAPLQPWGHPDFVLAAAVTAGVVTAEEEQLIGETRLEGVRLDDAAAARGITRKTLLTRRNRAERRLVAALRSGEIGGITVGGPHRRAPVRPVAAAEAGSTGVVMPVAGNPAGKMGRRIV